MYICRLELQRSLSEARRRDCQQFPSLPAEVSTDPLPLCTVPMRHACGLLSSCHLQPLCSMQVQGCATQHAVSTSSRGGAIQCCCMAAGRIKKLQQAGVVCHSSRAIRGSGAASHCSAGIPVIGMCLANTQVCHLRTVHIRRPQKLVGAGTSSARKLQRQGQQPGNHHFVFAACFPFV